MQAFLQWWTVQWGWVIFVYGVYGNMVESFVNGNQCVFGCVWDCFKLWSTVYYHTKEHFSFWMWHCVCLALSVCIKDTYLGPDYAGFLIFKFLINNCATYISINFNNTWLSHSSNDNPSMITYSIYSINYGVFCMHSWRGACIVCVCVCAHVCVCMHARARARVCVCVCEWLCGCVHMYACEVCILHYCFSFDLRRNKITYLSMSSN